MKKCFKIKNMWLVLLIPLVMGITIPGIASALEDEAVTVGPVTSAFVFMQPGQTKTYNVESDLYPAALILPIVVYGSGSLNISVSKNDTSGEVIGVMQLGGYNPLQIGKQYGANVGVTPTRLVLNARFWDWGYGIIMSGLLSSLEEGTHRYSVSLSYN